MDRYDYKSKGRSPSPKRAHSPKHQEGAIIVKDGPLDPVGGKFLRFFWKMINTKEVQSSYRNGETVYTFSKESKMNLKTFIAYVYVLLRSQSCMVVLTDFLKLIPSIYSN